MGVSAGKYRQFSGQSGISMCMKFARTFSRRHVPLLLAAALLFSVTLASRAQAPPPGPPPLAPAPNGPIPQPVFLYPQGAPGALGKAEADRPRFYPFLPAKPSSRTAVLILPGGGYSAIALGHEGFQ